MGKGKLAKFAEMAANPLVVECPTAAVMQEEFPLKGHWGEQFFHNSNPIVLELGCGRGEYTVGLGNLYPQKNFIGVDIKGARMWTGAKEALLSDMKNVGFLRTNIEFIHKFFAPGEVSEIWLTFSDPQMKKVTKRLSSTYFLQRYRQFMQEGGIIHLKTDSNFLFTYTRYMVEHNQLPVVLQTVDLYHDDRLDDVTRDILAIQTYYESMWIARGLNIKYMKWQLPHKGTLEEPDVEIELDDYRSYHRSKRSSLDKAK